MKKVCRKMVLSIAIFFIALSAHASAENVYDMRGMLPPVRDQGDFSTCWSFAVTGAMESNLIKKGLAEKDIDLSEYYLSYYTFNDESQKLYSFRSPDFCSFQRIKNG